MVSESMVRWPARRVAGGARYPRPEVRWAVGERGGEGQTWAACGCAAGRRGSGTAGPAVEPRASTEPRPAADGPQHRLWWHTGVCRAVARR
jgi:hypothetical protein